MTLAHVGDPLVYCALNLISMYLLDVMVTHSILPCNVFVLKIKGPCLLCLYREHNVYANSLCFILNYNIL